MDLVSGKLYWQTTCPEAPRYPALTENITCDVLIIGAGTSGAQCAYYLSEAGLKVAVVEKGRAGYGSTSASTALIQYLGDKMFFELVNTFGENAAVRHFQLCKQAIADIEAVTGSLSIDAEFRRRDSLYYASYEEDVEKLQKDYYYLQKYGFQAEWLDEEQIGARYPFKKRAAIYTLNDGELNPYRFTVGLLEKAKANSARIYEETEITGKKTEDGATIFYTKHHHSIRAKHVVIAAGYDCLEFKKEKNAVLQSTYAVITKPVTDLSSWYKRSLIWETARPYLYMRTTPDNRIVLGGLDEDTSNAEERDAKIIHKRDKLLRELKKLFPDIAVEAEYYLGAFFGGTHDGLPIIGHYEEMPRTFVLMAYGDNGIVYNMVLARIVRDLLTAGKSIDFDIYAHNRPLLKK